MSSVPTVKPQIKTPERQNIFDKVLTRSHRKMATVTVEAPLEGSQKIVDGAHALLPASEVGLKPPSASLDDKLFEKVSKWLKPETGLLFIHVFCHRFFPYQFKVNTFKTRQSQ